MIAANIIANVTSADESGAIKVSIIFPCIFPIIKDEDECEKLCWIIDIAISPGAKKLIKGKPNTFPLSFPIANESTDKNNKLDISGESKVCAQTTKNLLTSLTYRLWAPTQFIKPNLLTPIWYFYSISTISKYSYRFFKNFVKKTII